jgi:AcrR family transcriptional regulator
MSKPVQSRGEVSTDNMLDILRRDGLDGFTIGAVCRASGVSSGSIYHRFGDRRGLLMAAQDLYRARTPCTDRELAVCG